MAGLAVTHRLNDAQVLFVRAYVENGGNGSGAARAAGYADAASQAHYLTRQPHIQAAIAFEQRRSLMSLASLSLKALERVLRDPETRAGAIVDAAIKIIDRAGLAPKAGGETKDVPKEVARMSIAELQAYIKAAEADLPDVTPPPEAPTVPAPDAHQPQPIDIIEEVSA